MSSSYPSASVTVSHVIVISFAVAVIAEDVVTTVSNVTTGGASVIAGVSGTGASCTAESFKYGLDRKSVV